MRFALDIAARGRVFSVSFGPERDDDGPAPIGDVIIDGGRAELADPRPDDRADLDHRIGFRP